MKREIHVVMLPWVAFGHMIPFFQLSVALAKQGVRVSFVSTPRNIKRLPAIPKNVVHLEMVALPFPSPANDRLPPDAEATVDISPEDTLRLLMAHDSLAKPFKQFVSDQSPDWIFVDLIPHWVVDIAQECNVPLIGFHVMNAATMVFFGPPEYLVGEGQKRERSSPESLTIPPAWVNFPSSVSYPKYDSVGHHAGFYGTENAASESIMTGAKRLAKIYQGCNALAIRSCNEIEGDYLNLASELMKKPVIPAGILPPAQLTEDKQVTDEHWNLIFEWLDQQKTKSVVFVGFGSEVKLTKDQVYEIAYGLEASELPFLWALLKPNWASSDDDALPSDFIKRNNANGKGMVKIGWAPQRQILGHPSIGGSLFHSGWGSAIEALQYGHSLVALPFVVDQALNARMLVDKGLAIEVDRREEDGWFSGKDIAKCLKQAMVSEEGENLRKKARETALVIGDEKLHEEHYIGGLVQFLKKKVATN